MKENAEKLAPTQPEFKMYGHESVLSCCLAENETNERKNGLSTRIQLIQHTKCILIEWVWFLLCVVVSGRMKIFGFCFFFAGVDATEECQRKWSFLETMAREREGKRADEKNGSVVNPISFGVNCDSSRTTVFDIWTFPQNYPLILWNDVRIHEAPPSEKLRSNIFLRLHLFAMMSFRFCDHWHSAQPHSHRLMLQTTSICVGRCGDVSNTRYLRSLAAAAFGCRSAARAKYHYQFIIFCGQRTFVTLFTFFHWNREYHGIEWDAANGSHSHPHAGLLRRIRSMESLYAIILESIWFLGTQFTRHCLFLIGPIWRVSRQWYRPFVHSSNEWRKMLCAANWVLFAIFIFSRHLIEMKCKQWTIKNSSECSVGRLAGAVFNFTNCFYIILRALSPFDVIQTIRLCFIFASD